MPRTVLHVLIDSSIYRENPKRNNPAFRAFTRLAKGEKVELHLPFYVKQEFLTQQRLAVEQALNAIGKQANAIVRITGHDELKSYAELTKKKAVDITEAALKWVAEEFENWLNETRAVEHNIKPEHGQKVSDDYFSGAPPFTSSKHREDIPDSFIWQCALDLVQGGTTLHFLAKDGALLKAAKSNRLMVACGTIEEFIQKPECQQALRELLQNDNIASNIERAMPLIATQERTLVESLNYDIVNALSGKVVRHPSIPDDNNEATILSVYDPDELTFDFDIIQYYGDGELGIPFTALVNCTVYYALFKSDYYTLPDEKSERISITGELNDHYDDAEEDYPISVEGVLSIRLDIEALKREDLTDEDLEDLIHDADSEVEITEVSVYAPDE